MRWPSLTEPNTYSSTALVPSFFVTLNAGVMEKAIRDPNMDPDLGRTYVDDHLQFHRKWQMNWRTNSTYILRRCNSQWNSTKLMGQLNSWMIARIWNQIFYWMVCGIHFHRNQVYSRIWKKQRFYSNYSIDLKSASLLFHIAYRYVYIGCQDIYKTSCTPKFWDFRLALCLNESCRCILSLINKQKSNFIWLHCMEIHSFNVNIFPSHFAR